MAEITVEKQICPTCGADVRPQALFCYKCGGAVKNNALFPERKNGTGKSAAMPINEAIEKDAAESRQTLEKEVENKKNKSALPNLPDAKNSNVREEAKLKTAAAMRRKAKSFQKQEIQIVWEEPENDSGGKLLLVGLLLTIFAAVIILWALTMK